ncbi:MAG: hypothetical protein WC859_05925 [Elusimicrobiota bacterium]|jgi:hypothetical protein
MKLKKFAISLLLFVPFAGLWEGVQSLQTAPTKGISYASAFLPIADLDFSNLDARDTQNRPLKSVENQRILSMLFMENLFNLAVVAPLHSWRETAESASLFSRLFNNLFVDFMAPVLKVLDEAFLSSKRRVVHNVHNLWITISVGILIGILLSQNFCLERSVLKLNLRC